MTSLTGMSQIAHQHTHEHMSPDDMVGLVLATNGSHFNPDFNQHTHSNTLNHQTHTHSKFNLHQSDAAVLRISFTLCASALFKCRDQLYACESVRVRECVRAAAAQPVRRRRQRRLRRRTQLNHNTPIIHSSRSSSSSHQNPGPPTEHPGAWRTTQNSHA